MEVKVELVEAVIRAWKGFVTMSAAGAEDAS